MFTKFVSFTTQYLAILTPAGTKPGNFHIIIENDNVDKAYEQLRDFVIRELNQQRQAGKGNINFLLLFMLARY